MHLTKLTRFIGLPLLLLCASHSAYAGWWRVEAEPSVIANFANINLTAAQNQVGQEFAGAATANINGHLYQTICEDGTTLPPTPTRYDVFTTGVFLPATDSTSGGKTYVHVNEYMSAALSYAYDSTQFWLPVENVKLGLDVGSCHETKPHTGNTTYTISLKIKKPFVGVSHINVPLANIYTGDKQGTAYLKGAKQTIILTGTVTVPQSCILNADQTITIDFGNISSAAFKTAGAKADGVAPKPTTIAIQCINIEEGQANLTMRLGANTVSGNAIVSDNKDVGFVVTDNNNNPLKPNDLSSVIPFLLDPNAKASVTIKAYPVSVTGIKPVEGPVTSLAYLIVDFQ